MDVAWQDIAAGAGLLGVGALGVALTLLGLPGIWLTVAAAALVDALWRPALLTNAALVTLIALAALGELLEFAAGAAGARASGGSKRAAVGAIAGGVVGAVAGTVLLPLPVVGTILGAALGAGALALALELTARDEAGRARTLGQAVRVGRGAFAARLLATALKTLAALFALVALLLALLLPGF